MHICSYLHRLMMIWLILLYTINLAKESIKKYNLQKVKLTLFILIQKIILRKFAKNFKISYNVWHWVKKMKMWSSSVSYIMIFELNTEAYRNQTTVLQHTGLQWACNFQHEFQIMIQKERKNSNLERLWTVL